MPIWRSSELATGRPGSPSRRSSARSSASVGSCSRSAAPPSLRFSADGGAYDAQQQQLPAYPRSQAAAHQFASRHAGSGFASDSSSDSWETPQGLGFMTSVGAAGVMGGMAPLSAEQQHYFAQHPHHMVQHQGFIRRPPASAPTQRPSTGVSTQTYTVQYIGMANGELGILSQKQKLAAPKSPSTSSSGAATATATRRRSRSAVSVSSSSAAAAANTADGFITTSVLAPGTSGSQLLSPPATPLTTPLSARGRAPLPRAPQSPRAHAASAATAASPGPVPLVLASHNLPSEPLPETLQTEATLGLSGGPAEPAEGPTPSGSKPPRLSSIVDDASGRVKVISECFYSRALHSRGAPRDRHIRRNRPVGPLVQDMELLSTAMPGCFGNRAPSAGGFPGWKLSAAAAATTTNAVGGVSTGGGMGVGMLSSASSASAAAGLGASAVAAAAAKAARRSAAGAATATAAAAAPSGSRGGRAASAGSMAVSSGGMGVAAGLHGGVSDGVGAGAQELGAAGGVGGGGGRGMSRSVTVGGTMRWV